jgi:hypothetical protein
LSIKGRGFQGFDDHYQGYIHRRDSGSPKFFLPLCSRCEFNLLRNLDSHPMKLLVALVAATSAVAAPLSSRQSDSATDGIALGAARDLTGDVLSDSSAVRIAVGIVGAARDFTGDVRSEYSTNGVALVAVGDARALADVAQDKQKKLSFDGV